MSGNLGGEMHVVPKARRRAEKSVRPRDGILKPLPNEWFQDHRLDGSGEQTAEMRWGSVDADEYLTPTERFFVRSHSGTPLVNANDWVLKIEGAGVERVVDLTYEDLLALPSVTVVKALECAGNGRVSFGRAHGTIPPGTPWSLGAIGVAEWTGVPLSEVLAPAGVRPEAIEVLAEGMDEARVRRPIPIAKALKDTLVVVAMNGRPLPADHGFPARLLVPGWAAIASIKWLGRLEVTDRPVSTPWNTETYALKGPDYPPAAGGRPQAVEGQVMKSALELDAFATIPAGSRQVTGRSWSPTSIISRVEVSFDDGASWRHATLRPPNLPGAWVRWHVPWDPRPGEYRLRVRATDLTGRSQPDEVPWNDHGYLYGGVASYTLRVVAGAGGATDEQPDPASDVGLTRSEGRE
ncbi:MAG TPA: sulfite oxidase [Actinomycetota bacterium]|nr:sulfite oxidase [Actinomycetota bacterium]